MFCFYLDFDFLVKKSIHRKVGRTGKFILFVIHDIVSTQSAEFLPKHDAAIIGKIGQMLH